MLQRIAVALGILLMLTGCMVKPYVLTIQDVQTRATKDLKKRGFRFVGSTIIYAYMQAAGLVNDHATDCFLCARR